MTLRGSSGQRITLATGTLEVNVTRADLALEDLCDFAARRNPKRGFLFVSKVLGRHLPARPSIMRDVHRCLADRIPANLPGPIVMVGLAETAICLGQGVHAQYLERTGRQDVLFIHTTRHRLDHPVAFDFLEEHSHAARHVVYLPETFADRVLFKETRSLILIDDEVSTGSTFVNLTRAFLKFTACLEQVLCLTMTDWRGLDRAQVAKGAMPVFSSWTSLLEGEYRFSPRAAETLEKTSFGDQALVNIACSPRNDGRLGLRVSPAPPAKIVERLRISPGDRILILGTGEFCYLPFRLAEMLEEAGGEVYCQATTRSPALIGHAIRCAETFPDSYGGSFPNFLYNVNPGMYDHIFLCSDTPVEAFASRLLQSLSAIPLLF